MRWLCLLQITLCNCLFCIYLIYISFVCFQSEKDDPTTVIEREEWVKTRQDMERHLRKLRDFNVSNWFWYYNKLRLLEQISLSILFKKLSYETQLFKLVLIVQQFFSILGLIRALALFNFVVCCNMRSRNYFSSCIISC